MTTASERIRAARDARELELHLAREALAGPLGTIERDRIIERIGELEAAGYTGRRPITEAELERIADQMVQRRLGYDRAYRNAETAEEQSRAEERIERDVLTELNARYDVV